MSDLNIPEDKMVSTNGYLSQVENRVSLLQQSYSSMEKEHLGLELRLERLKQRKQSDVSLGGILTAVL